MTTNYMNQTSFEFGGFVDNYTTIDNTILNEKSISAKAVGIYCKIVQYRNSSKHKIYVNSLTSAFKDGRQSILSGLKELEELGYLSKIRLRDTKGRMCGYKYFVYATPIPMSDRGDIKDFIQDEQGNLYPAGSQELKSCAAAPKHNQSDLSQKETELINLYKNSHVEKRFMPQTKELLLSYVNEFDIDVFGEVFAVAASDDVKKKYAYLKATFAALKEKGIHTIEEYYKDTDTYKSRIETKVLTKKLKDEYAAAGLDENGHSTNTVDVVAGSFDDSIINDDVTLEDINYYTPNGNVEVQMDITDYNLSSEVCEPVTKATEEEIDTTYDIYKDAYELAMCDGMDVILSQVTKFGITEYAHAHGLPVPQ